jgi:hypothetical protein
VGTLPSNVIYGSAYPPIGNGNGLPPVESYPGNGAVPGDGTYPYNGGPLMPVPMPPADAAPAVVPRIQPIPEARVVSLTPGSSPTTGKWVYPAYGEVPRRTGR